MLHNFLMAAAAAAVASAYPLEKDAATGSFLAYNVMTRSLYKSTDLSNWETIANGTLPTGMYNANIGTCIAYGNGIYVAIDVDASKIYSSPDGIVWTLRYSQNQWRGYNVKFLNGRFFVYGETISVTYVAPIAHSVDGINWTQITTGTQYHVSNSSYKARVLDIEYAFGKYVFIGYMTQYSISALSTSVNLVNFTSVGGFSYDMVYARITYDDTKLYIAGHTTANAYQVLSYNGTTLSNNANLYSGVGLNFYLAKNLNSTKLLLGNSASVGTLDKSTGAYAGLFTNINPRAFLAGNGKLVIGCTGVNKFTSDGVSWTDVAIPGSSPNLVFCKS